MATPRGHASRLKRNHRRAYSANSASNSLSPVKDGIAVFFNRSETPEVTYEESWIDTQLPMTSTTSSHPLKIKPYLRKLQAKDSNGLDLSRPAAENDLSGLGISEYGYSQSLANVTFAPVNGRHRHTRSVSSNSQFSTSSLQRPTPLPAIRQTPQPYAPQLSRSTPPSVLLGSEHEGDDIMNDEPYMPQNTYDPARRRSGSPSSVPGVSLRIHTNNSSTRLASSYSQSSVSLTSPVAQARSRGDTLKSIDTTASPSSRTSFDQTYRFIRGGRDSPVDAASRAASIRAARLKFEEDERAKERKYEKEAHKQQERDYRKQLKKDDLLRRKSDTIDGTEYKHSRSTSDAPHEKTPRPSVGGRQYSDHREAHSNSLPTHVSVVDPEKQSSAAPKVTKSRAAKGTWLRFITWFKTRLLRMSGG